MYLVYLKYWTLNLMPLMVYAKVVFHPNFSIKVQQGAALSGTWDVKQSKDSQGPCMRVFVIMDHELCSTVSLLLGLK